MLQESRLPFRMKVIINGREADFLVGSTLIVEVGNHPGENDKNKIFLEAGYDLLDFSNDELREQKALVINKIKKFYVSKNN